MLGEAVQTVLRAAGVADGYERLKEFTRGRAIDGPTLAAFIDALPLPAAEKARLQGAQAAKPTPGSPHSSRAAPERFAAPPALTAALAHPPEQMAEKRRADPRKCELRRAFDLPPGAARAQTVNRCALTFEVSSLRSSAACLSCRQCGAPTRGNNRGNRHQ